MEEYFDRRDVLLGAAVAIAAPGALARQSPEFVRSGPVKGIGIVAPIQNWDAASYGLTERRTAALHKAGFNTLRVFIASRV